MQFARELEKAARSRGLEARVVDLEEVTAGSFPATRDGLAVFILACFGHGEPTSNAEEFYYDLMDEAGGSGGYAERVRGQPFAVLGLGQSAHYPERYQAVGRAVDRRLEELGACRVLARGEADDSADVEEDFERWADALWAAIEGDNEPKRRRPAPPRVLAPASPPQPAAPGQVRSLRPHTYTHARPYAAPIVRLDELTSPRSGRSVKHVEFDVSGGAPDMSYTTGDYVGVVPENDPARVEEVAQTLGLRLDRELDLARHQALLRAAGPGPLTLRHALTRHLDVASVPRRSVLRSLAALVESADARERLELMAGNTPLGHAEYADFVVANQMSLLELLEVFPVPFVPEDDFADLLPPLSPRFYSISSSSAKEPGTVAVAASVVDFETRLGRRHRGVCTDYLARRSPGDTVPVFVKESLFRAPADPLTPLIMICAGTGVAPFRAFIEERLHQKSCGAAVGPMTLFFGIGRRNEDYIYRGLLETARREGDLNLELCCGFERGWRDFVQFRMVRPSVAASVWRHIRDGAMVYVCGDSRRMAPAVHAALVEIAHVEGGMPRDEGEAFFKGMQDRAAYQMDVY